MERIGGETMVLYSDLLERLDTFEAMRNVAHLQGEIVRKTVKGTVYYYFQATLPTGRTQIYLGPDNENVRRLIEARRAGENAVRADVAMLQRLSAQIMAGGAQPVSPAMAKVISRLADSGVFRLPGEKSKKLDRTCTFRRSRSADSGYASKIRAGSKAEACLPFF